jgi:hypothetical protein
MRSSVAEMDFVERITLNPLEKYIRFDKFPWKFVVHLLLIALCTYQSLRMVEMQDKHTRIQEQVFSTIYLQDDDGSSSYPYYSLSEFADGFFSVINNTLALDDTLLQYSLVDDVTYELQVYYTQITPENRDALSVNGTSDSFLGELERVLGISSEDIVGFKKFLQGVENMALKIDNLQTYISEVAPGQYADCLNWTIDIGYSLQSLANVESTLEASSKECAGTTEEETETLVGIHVAIILAASLSLFLSWRQVYDVSKEYLYFKKKTVGGASESRFKGHTHWEKDW